MRPLIILMVAANVAVFLYWNVIETQERSPQPIAPAASTPTILTAAERPAPGAQCQSLGPVPNRQVLASVTAWLGDRYGAVVEREESLPAPPIYRVQLETASADLANRLAQRLRASGVNDIAVLPPEPGETAVIVAMGLFADRANADRRLQDLHRRGIDGQVTDIERNTSQWWVDFTSTDRPDTEALVRAVPAAVNIGLAPCVFAMPNEDQPADGIPKRRDSKPPTPGAPSTGLPSPSIGASRAKGAVV
jgi:SPOR domain